MYTHNIDIDGKSDKFIEIEEEESLVFFLEQFAWKQMKS